MPNQFFLWDTPTGSTQDIQNRLRSLIPAGWIGSPSPVIDTILWGIAAVLSYLYGLIAYARLQTRIHTATDGFLDLIAIDFYGPGGLPRQAGESDSSYRTRILAGLFPPANTKIAIIAALTKLTGKTPRLVEPWNPSDTGVINGDAIGQPDAMYIDVDTAANPSRLSDQSTPASFYVDTVTPPAQSLILNFLQSIKSAGVNAWARFNVVQVP